MRKLYIDVETTAGFVNEIVELSYIYTMNDMIIETYTARILHTEPITSTGYEIHGIADYMCDTPIEDAFQKLYIVLRNADLVIGHNVDFDLGRIMSYNNELINNLLAEKRIYCTMKNSKCIFKLTYNSRRRMVQTSYGSLFEAEAYLIMKGYTEDYIKREFRKVFKDALGLHHSSAYDTFVCYLFEKETSNAKQIQ